MAGEKLFLVDEMGAILDDITAAALMLELGLQSHPGSNVVVPVTMPNSFDIIAGWRHGQIRRISNNLQSLMRAAANPDVLFGADGAGSFIFPAFHPTVDGMIAAAKLLEYLAKYRRDIAKYAIQVSEIVRYLPPFHLAEAAANCPANAKGAVMRQLNEQYGMHNDNNIEGVRIQLAQGEWVHIAPHPDAPYFSIVAEAGTLARAQSLVEEHHFLLEQMLAVAQG